MAKKDNVEATEAVPESAPPAPAEELSESELQEKVQSAMAAGDFAEAKRLLTTLAKGQKDKEKAELEAKQQELKGITEEVKQQITGTIQKLRDAGKLDKADFVKFLWVFTDNTIECGLVKSAQAKARSGAGAGTGQKFAVRTSELLSEYGEEPYKDTGMTFKEAWDSDENGNWRYNIRKALLEKAGYMETKS